MRDPRLWTTAGLILDMVGAACLLVPVLRLSRAAIRRHAATFWKEELETESGLAQLWWARFGLGLLFLGFALQIVGTCLR